MTKPRIIAELLVTTAAAMVVAARGLPALNVVGATLIGGALCAGAAATYNQLFDRDIDRVMQRTRDRPLPAARLSVPVVIWWGAVLLSLSVVVLGFGVSWLAAGLASGGFAIYVGIYTLWLKRRSTQNIVIGGAAGAIPPMVGWVAGAGRLDAAAVVLFIIIFVWTPPHFWALALVRKHDYARAGVPMLPVVQGDAVTRRHIFVYSLALVAASLVLIPVNHMGWIYSSAAALLGFVFIYRAWHLLRSKDTNSAWRLYRYSITYLTLVFAAMVADTLLLSVG
jgi:protoheme IX farnesyltransferase